ncbi:MAG TPA: LLM class flavin-dependent oxidoreductase [Thermomicrobiaceae bacterium]|nr:LLM class flavin-dependent oxidoreductase [Thermomicrobiaceae bacterium]
MEYGLKTSQPGAGYRELAGAWQAAERAGFTSAWIYDHLTALGDPTQPTLEAWTLLAALATQTSTLRIGVLVTDNTLRHPALLAREAVTVDHVSDGRLEVGLGAGNPRSEVDYRGYGLHDQPIGERISRLGEACRVLLDLWTQESVDFHGRYYRLTEARPAIWPVQQPHPPLWIGGSGDRVLRITARYADGWNYTGPLDRFPDAVTRLRAAQAEAGRDPATLRVSAQFFLGDKTPGDIRDEVARYEAAGADLLMAIIERPYTPDAVERAAAVLMR